MILQKEIIWLILDSLVPNDQIVQEVRQLVHTYHIVCVIKETFDYFTIGLIIKESVDGFPRIRPRRTRQTICYVEKEANLVINE